MNATIHATAIVDPAAKIGARSTIQSHAVIEGDVTIGENNLVGHSAIIGTPPQDLSFKPETKSGVIIGNNNVIRELCTIHRGTAEGSTTKLGDNNFLMAGAHVGHNCEIGNYVIIANNCLLGGHVRVGDGAFLGGGCVFHQNIRVGRLAITQGLSAFSMDIPPFVIAAERNQVFGLNAIGMRRAGFSASQREEIKAAFKLIYTSGMNVSEALAKSTEMKLGDLAEEFFEFVRQAKKRGICPYRGGDEEPMSI